MLARFFIDRPIFAVVVSIVITLAGLIALFSLPIAQYPQITPPSVAVSISYPGASADVVAQTVAAPIEQSVNGVQGMLYMSSTSGSDGSYSLSVTFDVGTDLNTALVMVQNRVTLAMPLLPSSVQNQGITIRKKTPDQLMIISLYTTDKNYTNIDLSNFALINLKDELLRVDGVSDINIMGEKDFSIRVWLDPQKLAARNLTAIDVANAVRSQSIPVAAGQIGQPPAPKNQLIQLPIDMLSRLSTPEQFGAIIVKVAGGSPSPSAGTKTAPAAASMPTQGDFGARTDWRDVDEQYIGQQHHRRRLDQRRWIDWRRRLDRRRCDDQRRRDAEHQGSQHDDQFCERLDGRQCHAGRDDREPDDQRRANHQRVDQQWGAGALAGDCSPPGPDRQPH